MKRLIAILAVFSLACLGAGASYGAWPVGTEFMPPGSYVDYVDIGDYLLPDDVTVNLTSTEAAHNMLGWGAIQPIWSAGGGYGGMATEGGHCRPMQHILNNGDGSYSTTGFAYVNASYPYTDPYFNETGTPDTYYCGDPWASLDLDFGLAGGTKTLYIRYLDGGGGANGDNFDVFLNGEPTCRLQITTSGAPEIWEMAEIVVSDLVGINTVKFVSQSPTSGFTPQYGLTCIDQVGIIIENVDPVIAPIAVDPDPINCSDTKLVNFHYTPGDAPEVRGYTVRVACDASLTFDDTDVTFATLPTGASVHTEITEITAGHVYKLDYAIMGGSVGISAEADLFSVNFHGAGTGTGVVSMTNVDLRDLDNIFITPVTFNGTAGIPVDCTAPDAPTWVEVPDYTQGTAITVTWLDESATGASAYYAEYSDDGFASVLGFKDWTTDLFYALTGLTDGVTYSFRVKARDDLNNISLWSDVESSTQDATAPVTKVTALDQFQVDSFFDVSYEIELPEDGSDFTKVELFYKGPGVTTWTYYGEFVDDTTPLVFNTGMVVGDPDGTFFFYSKGTDHVVNEEQPPGSDGDTSTTVDMTDLDVIFFLINDGDNKTASEDVELSMEVVGATSMQFSNTNNGTDWSPDPAVSYATTADWTLDPTTEGTRTVYARFLEIPSNRWTYEQDDIIIDKTAPGNINNLSAERGLEKVKLAWTNPGGDQTGVEVWRAVWHNGDYVTSVYPEYDDVGGNQKPSIPLNWAAAVADPAWGKVITLGIVAAYSDLLPDRGIYYYAVYPVDGAGLHGGSNGASSISYLLGDVQTGYDGTVLGGDVSILGIAYGTTHAGGGLYNNKCDVGPTSDYSGSGIPATDDNIDFDDLMIFALNWNITPLTKIQPAEGGMIARFSWEKNDDTTWSLVLTEPCANLKGVNLQADLPQDAILSVTPGSLLGQQDCSYFLKNIPKNGLDAGMALLGNGASITGQGELIRISLAGEFDPGDILIVARDTDNKDLEYTLEETTAEADMPTRYMLSANYPNPFNPSTKIDFALPESQHVKLAVFSIDGRRIATLKNETMPAGRYTVTWTGRDDQGGLVASGIYFYRIQAGDFSRIQKMTLLK